MNRTELKEKANKLPLAPGIYIMKDSSGAVIYVGKAKKLRNRVSQYFADLASHTPKTRMMVSKVDDFDVIVAATEFEALVLECAQIKQYSPKYNILLKDDKGFPYLRLDMKQAYPVITMVNKPVDDGAEYFGPFGSRSLTGNLIDAIRQTMKLPSCSKKFPRDVGKERPCLTYHMNQCAGWCQEGMTQSAYRLRMEQTRQLLLGNYRAVAEQLRLEMLESAQDLNFELAAGYRDRMNAVEALGKKQLVTAGKLFDTDVIGFAQTETRACFVVLHFCEGNLLEKDVRSISSVDDPAAAVASLLRQYYTGNHFAPKQILLPFEPEDRELTQQLLAQVLSKSVKLLVPKRGDKAQLVSLAVKNATEEAERITSREERINAIWDQLGRMVGVRDLHRVEAFDISNISGTDMVASMVVYKNGKPSKGDYKKFKLRDMRGQDDYAAMYQVVSRRFHNFQEACSGFEQLPDLLLIDGGVEHCCTALRALEELDIHLPVFGMVKDERHRTRALVTPQGEQIAIDSNQSVFSLVGNIQEQAHRFAITFHRQQRSKRLRYSVLDSIPGIGPKRKQQLLKQFGSIGSISEASLDDLLTVLPLDAAHAVFDYFDKKRG